MGLVRLNSGKTAMTLKTKILIAIWDPEVVSSSLLAGIDGYIPLSGKGNGHLHY